MGNCFSYLKHTLCCNNPEETIEFSEQLLQPLNDNYINNNFNRIYQNLLNMERKIYLLEENTQKNLKLLSEDIHHIHNKNNDNKNNDDNDNKNNDDNDDNNDNINNNDNNLNNNDNNYNDDNDNNDYNNNINNNYNNNINNDYNNNINNNYNNYNDNNLNITQTVYIYIHI